MNLQNKVVQKELTTLLSKMGIIELISAGGGLILGGIMTIWSQSMKDRAQMVDHLLQKNAAGEESAASARETVAPWKGYYWVRAAIAIIATCYFFILPGIAIMFFNNVQVVVGYFDTTQGFWPWSSDFQSITWVKMGPAEATKVLVYDPIKNNIMISIISMYFGNQFTRRG